MPGGSALRHRRRVKDAPLQPHQEKPPARCQRDDAGTDWFESSSKGVGWLTGNRAQPEGYATEGRRGRSPSWRADETCGNGGL